MYIGFICDMFMILDSLYNFSDGIINGRIIEGLEDSFKILL